MSFRQLLVLGFSCPATMNFFQGTSDRIIMVSGTFDEIMRAMELIIEKLSHEEEDGNDADGLSSLKLAVPNSSCGAIIGKGGATIKSFIEDSHANIKISPQDSLLVGVRDRLVTLTGTQEELIRAVELILSKLIEDAYYLRSISSPWPYVGLKLPGHQGVSSGISSAYNTGTHETNATGGKFPSKAASARSPTRPLEHQNDTLTFAVPDEHIGAILGRGGRNIMEITQTTGTKIKISERGVFLPGTNDRKVTITGSRDAIAAAEDLIKLKITANSES
ncbi:K Homology domain-containing protein [Dioscorea alata]|uniref:K Homology domain-containing protein n=1 Tax=Dioscorea alata TaxID=55571 RepID=A0ACB7V817_DIOAL|nr:K Homology domain-containing protein [Dioscorea alata]